MLKRPLSPIQEAMDQALTDALSAVNRSDTDAVRETHIKQLAALAEINKTLNGPKISKDVVVGAFVNLAGILMILQHEKANVIATKAVGFVSKLR